MTACCPSMRAQLEWACAQHADPADCPDALVSVDAAGRYGLLVHDGGSSALTIAYCPWCGGRLDGDR